MERLSTLPDGRLAYRMKRPASSGATVLVLTPGEFLRHLTALIPPPRVNLVRFFGVLAPNARLREHVVPRPLQTEVEVTALPSPGVESPPPPARRKTSRVPWAELLKRTFSADVLTCDKCGGKRRVVACVFSSSITAEILEHLRMPHQALPRASARAPPQLEMC